jgi:2-dehydro-3-deoxy-D-arabinonate dehydratase
MPLTHVGQYWSSARREVRLLGSEGIRSRPDGGLAGAAVDLDLDLPGERRRFRAASRGRPWDEVRWTYSGLPFPAVELAEAAGRAGGFTTSFRARLEDALAAGAPLDLALLDRAPDPGADHLVAPIIPRRAHGFGVTYANSALERETEGARGDYGYVYRAVKERGERPEIFLKGTAPEHFVGPHGLMGLRRDRTNSCARGGEVCDRVTVAAGIEPELAAVVLASGEIWGYTLANDVSGNRIENETLLYLTQAKHFTGSLVLGPLILLSREAENPRLDITARIFAPDGGLLFEHATNTRRINAPISRLIDWARSHVRLQPGEVFSTGTDCVPSGVVKVLSAGMTVEISSPALGALRHGAREVPGEGDLNLDYSRLELSGESASGS